MLKDDTHKLLLKMATAIHSRASAKAPVDTGKLRGDIGVLEEGVGAVSVGNTPLIEYAKYVYFGTGVFGEKKKPITAKRAKALKTPYGYRKSVKGIKPNRYLEDALSELMRNGTIDRIVDDAKLDKSVLDALDLDGFASRVS